MFRSVLVPLDGSPSSEHALPVALNLVRRCEGRLRVVRVHELFPPAYGASVGFSEQVNAAVKQQERDYLDTINSRLPAADRVRTTIELLDGDIVPALQADMIGLATHGRHGLNRLLFGSVADKLIRSSTLPILLTRQKSQ
jgi:nucleotide-binding universal stress UspA family protein